MTPRPPRKSDPLVSTHCDQGGQGYLPHDPSSPIESCRPLPSGVEIRKLQLQNPDCSTTFPIIVTGVILDEHGHVGGFTSASPRCLDGGDVDLLHRHHRLEATLALIAASRKRIG